MVELDLGLVRFHYQRPPWRRVVFISVPSMAVNLIMLYLLGFTVSAVVKALVVATVVAILFRIFWDVYIRDGEE